MENRRVIPSIFISTEHSSLLQKPLESKARIPDVCALSAASYSSRIRPCHLLHHRHVVGLSSERRTQVETDKNRLRIRTLSCLVLKHQQEFKDLKLPLLSALKGDKIEVEPSWELDQSRRLSLIQILHLLSNMVSRREYLSSSLISTGFTAALNIFESLDLEKTLNSKT